MADKDPGNVIVLGDEDLDEFFELLNLLEDDDILTVTLEINDDKKPV